jgi:hypothetical protein
VTDAEREAAGFVFVPEIGRWVHDAGDDVGNMILAGDISRAQAAEQQERAEREARARGAISKLPREEDVEDLREVAPGRWRFVRRAGRRYRDVEKTIRQRISKEQQQ